jgi:uncharacterized membrane protein
LPQEELAPPEPPPATPEIIKPPPEVPVPIPSEVPTQKPHFDQDFEFKLGGKIFTGIGAIAVTLGIGFFFRYAFENNLITETMRVVLGIIGGIVLLLIGEFTRRRFPSYSQILTGGGLGILYLSIYAAFNNYQLVSQPVAFLGMIIVTVAGVFLAIRYDSILLAGFAQIGGFITPFVLSSGEGNAHALFLYIAVLDVGILAIARWKLWRLLTFGSSPQILHLTFHQSL